MNLDPFLLWLLSASLRASLLALAVTCLQFVLRPWLPARWRYALWLPVALVLIAPALPTSRLSVQNYFASDAMIAQNTPQTATAPIVPAEIPLVTTAHASWKPNGQQILFAIWLLGAGGVTVVGLIGYSRSLQRIQRRAIEADVALKRSITSLAQRIKLRRVPRVIVSNAVESPAVAGFLRPMLLLPANFPAGFTETESHLVLLHELMHLKRHDLPVNWLLCLLQVLHWFNPLLWLTFSRMRADREAACDAQVLAFDSKDHRKDYGNALLKLQSVSPYSNLSLAFIGIFERGTGLRSRIRSIARHGYAHPMWSVAAIAIIAALIMLGATNAESKDMAKKREIVWNIQFFALPQNYYPEGFSEPTNLPEGKWVYAQPIKDAAAFLKTLNQEREVQGLGKFTRQNMSGYPAQVRTGLNPAIQNENQKKPEQEGVGISLDILPKLVSQGIRFDMQVILSELASDHIDKLGNVRTPYWGNGTTNAKTGEKSPDLFIKDEQKQALKETVQDGQTIALLVKKYIPNKQILIVISSRIAPMAGGEQLMHEMSQLNRCVSPKSAEAKASPSTLDVISDTISFDKEKGTLQANGNVTINTPQAVIHTDKAEIQSTASNALVNNDPPITLALNEVPLATTLDYIARAVNRQVLWKDDAAVISGSKWPLLESPQAPKGKAAELAQKIIVPDLNFHDISCSEALSQVATLTGWKLHTDGDGFVLEPPSATKEN